MLTPICDMILQGLLEARDVGADAGEGADCLLCSIRRTEQSLQIRKRILYTNKSPQEMWQNQLNKLARVCSGNQACIWRFA